MKDSVWITLTVIILIAVLLGSYYVRQSLKGSPWIDKALFDRGMELPPLWIYYDDSQVNSRHWLDFGARSSRVLNQPYLNLCYESIIRANGKFYRTEVIKGINGVMERLGELPPKLKGPIGHLKTVGPAERNWIRAAVLAKYGGLWIEPTTIALRGFGALPEDRVVFFGTDHDESFAGPEGTAVPSLAAIWVPKPNNPAMQAWEAAARERLSGAAGGGSQIRGDAKWDFVRFFQGNKDSYEVRPEAELRRAAASGKLLQLEDFLAQSAIHFSVPSTAIYVSLPARDLELRRNWNWFLRMSEEQVLESDLVITQLLKMSLSS
jgi:hypothetical protein